MDATEWFLLQNLLSAQHVSGTVMPVIRSSEVIQMVAACGTWRFGLQVVGLVWGCRLCVRVAGEQHHQLGRITYSSTPYQRPVSQSATYHRQQPSV